VTFYDPVAVLRIAGDLLTAAVLGGGIGLQRQVTQKSAGFRTHLLVGVGACAFAETARIVGDWKIAEGVVSGIGFLGAGAIVREGLQPRGLTTAASIWAAASAGVAVGVSTRDGYALAVLMTLVVLIALIASDESIQRFFPRHEAIDALVTFDLEALGPEDLTALFLKYDVRVAKTANLSIVRDEGKRVASWRIELRSNRKGHIRTAISEVSKNRAIHAVGSADTPTPT
jgi:putative Mg2+ transporter-C (MgtC) family protein